MLTDLEKIEGSSRRVVELLKRHFGAQRRTTSGLPAQHERLDTSNALTPFGAQGVGVAPTGSLLVVEGHASNRALLSRFLAEQGHEVRTAASDSEALELAARRAFDLVLLDLTTPLNGGLPVLETLRHSQGEADLPVVLICSPDDRDQVVAGLRLGANDYLSRPLDLQVAQARIRSQLALKIGRDQLGQLRRQLECARARVARLASSSSSALEDVGGWCSEVVEEVREATGAQRLAVFSTAGDGQVVAGDDEVPAPTAEQLQLLKQGGPVDRRSDALLAVRGYSGELVGALVLGPPGVLRSEEVCQLLASFCAHLGGVLEMDRLRRRLAVSTERRRLSRQEMIDRGIDALQICPECGGCFDHRLERCAADQTLLATPPRPLPYRIDNRYRLTCLLGKGGMGTVFRSRDEQLDRDVAIKILQARFFGDERMSIRFENEARALARISHAGVIGVHDVGLLEDGSRYIVMELLVGCNLKALMRAHGPGTPAQVGALLRQGSAALHASHAAGVIHRDIKPENVFVLAAPGGLKFKLLDFGIAKELSVGADVTCTGDLVGTPRYMAPEQLVGATVDGRADLYSFAAVAYEALVGRPLVSASDFARVLLETFRRTPPAVSTLLPKAPIEIDRAFSHAFTRRPERRPSRASDWVESFVEQLERMPPSVPGWPDDIASALAHTEVETQIDHQRPEMLERTSPTADLRRGTSLDLGLCCPPSPPNHPD